jgi:tryptophan synthase alpha chain
LPSPTAARPTTFPDLFAARRAESRLALLPWVMAGERDDAAAVALLEAMVEAGADGFEISIPFSDPMADGPTVQRANQRGLERGMSVGGALQLLTKVRERISVPIALMGYVNPFIRYGLERFCREAVVAGANGLIVPDVPFEESLELTAATSAAGLDLISFVAPTTSAERARLVAQNARGFVYCVALTGVTGARTDLAAGLDDLLLRVRAATKTPVVVGFGISRPEHLARLRGKADGAIVASALVDIMEKAGDGAIAAAAEFVTTLRAGADGTSSS